MGSLRLACWSGLGLWPIRDKKILANYVVGQEGSRVWPVERAVAAGVAEMLLVVAERGKGLDFGCLCAAVGWT